MLHFAEGMGSSRAGIEKPLAGQSIMVWLLNTKLETLAIKNQGTARGQCSGNWKRLYAGIMLGGKRRHI